VSWRIRALERTLGARLFERSGKGVKLTQTGATFLERALVITDNTRRALDEVGRSAPSEDRVPQRRPARRGRKPRATAR
jgi:DNA-binding transcriptional LysR family regulator